MTKFPWTKYTPFWIENDDPTIADPDCSVDANGVLAAIELLPSKPEVISVLQTNYSPSLKDSVELLTVLELK